MDYDKVRARCLSFFST